MTKKLGYLRVSKDDQSPDRQVDGLRSHCDELFIEQGVSAIAQNRPIFEQVIGELGEGDTLVVWDLDRAFRSAIDAVMVADTLRKRGVHFQIVNLSVDTSTPAGMLVYTVMAAQAEFERSNLSQRTKEGLAAAKRRGKQLGRPKALSRQQLVQARKLREEGETYATIADLFNVNKRTVSRVLKLEEVSKPAIPKQTARTNSAAAKKKKAASRKKPLKKVKVPPVELAVDAIGLARPVNFQDFPAAVSVLSEEKTLPIMGRFEWQASAPRSLMAVWEAEQHIAEFRSIHAAATVEQRYKVADKTIIELTAAYGEDKASHRVIYQAKNK